MNPVFEHFVSQYSQQGTETDPAPVSVSLDRPARSFQPLRDAPRPRVLGHLLPPVLLLRWFLHQRIPANSSYLESLGRHPGHLPDQSRIQLIIHPRSLDDSSSWRYHWRIQRAHVHSIFLDLLSVEHEFTYHSNGIGIDLEIIFRHLPLLLHLRCPVVSPVSTMDRLCHPGRSRAVVPRHCPHALPQLLPHRLDQTKNLPVLNPFFPFLPQGRGAPPRTPSIGSWREPLPPGQLARKNDAGRS